MQVQLGKSAMQLGVLIIYIKMYKLESESCFLNFYVQCGWIHQNFNWETEILSKSCRKIHLKCMN